MRTLWWVEGASVFGKAVADGWCFHMEGECWLSDTPCRRSKCPLPPALLQALFILEDVILRWLLQAQSLKDVIQKSHGGGTARLFAVVVPCPSVAQASKEALPFEGSWRSPCSSIGCWLCSSSPLQRMQVLLKCTPM